MFNVCKNDGDIKKRFSKILRTVFLIFIGLIIGASVYNWNAKSLVGDELPMPFEFGVSVVLSGSMEPELSVGDLIIVKEDDNYNINDIVVYQDNGSLTVHRVISVNEDIIITKGDSNGISDKPIQLSLIEGKVIKHIPLIGKFITILKMPTVVLGIVGVAFVLLELSYHQEKNKDIKDIDLIKEEIRKLKEDK